MIDRYIVVVLTTTVLCCGMVGCINKTINKYKQQEMIYFDRR